MKIIITGSESFVGKELISQLKNNNFEIIGFDSINAQPIDYEFHKVDIRDPEIHKFIPEGTDVIIHLAALSRDPDCRGKPYECFDVNVMGTLNLMNASSMKKVKQFVFASSEWVYDEFKENEIKDEGAFINIFNHHSEYALSKLVSENNLRQKYEQGFCSVTILRFGIIYGPRKNNWAAVESILNTIKNQSEVKVGSLRNARRFIHISDIANGIRKSIGLTGFNILNLTGDKLITMKDLIEKSQIVLGKSVKIIETDPSQRNIRNPSNEKAKQILLWKPEIDLETGLKSILPFM
jgi:UDP-glucose 4-epimerase